MGVPMPEMEPVENATAEALLSSLKTIAAGERRKHATVFNYWQSIRQNRQFPPIRDLDPLEISDAGPWSILLEMAGGGEDAVLRHFGQAIRLGLEVEKIGQAPNPSLLASIHNKLPIVAACRQAYAFEEAFETDDGTARCWVTLLPFSETGTWIDYVYGFVSLDLPGVVEAVGPAEEEPEAVEQAAESAEEPEAVAETEAAQESEAVEEPGAALEPEAVEQEAEAVEEVLEPFQVPLGRLDGEAETSAEPEVPLELAEEPVEAVAEPEPEAEAVPEPETEPEAELEAEPEQQAEPEPEAAEIYELEEPLDPESMIEPEDESAPAAEWEPEPESAAKPSFSSKLLDSLASFSGFHGRVVQADAITQDESASDEIEQAAVESEAFAEVPELVADEQEAVADTAAVRLTSAVEGTLHSKLTDVRAKAEEARQAQLACDRALYEGLGAAYDFALDAEQEPEEYLRLVEAQGLKIQLRSPMTPVARLAFDGTCDEASFAQLEAVLAWALKQDLPRGSLPDRIEAEGGIGQILGKQASAA